MAPSKKLLFRILGIMAALAVAVLVATSWLMSTLYESEQADDAHASKVFAEVRGRFPGVEPAFAIREGRLEVVRPAQGSSSTRTTEARMLVWQPRARTLSRVTLPLWISSVATEPVPLEALTGIADQGFGRLMNAKRRGDELNIRISDLQRYGRTLLLDGVTPDGKQVMMWNE